MLWRTGGSSGRTDRPGPRLLDGPRPVLIDEWRYVPESWDLVRRAVDAGAEPGSFLLTGSSRPAERGSHSGAARILSIRMRPLALSERGLATSTVSLPVEARSDDE